jgi:hypothetical protein
VPINGAVSVTLTRTPNIVTYVSRNGIIESSAAGHFTIAGPTITFSTALDGTERVEVAYSISQAGALMTTSQVAAPWQGWAFSAGGVLFGGPSEPTGGLGGDGDFYFRTDTPSVVNQRIYNKQSGVWVGIV